MRQGYFIIGLVFALGIILFFTSPLAESYIPPTKAFDHIFSGANNVTAKNSTAGVIFVAGGNMTITANNLANTVTFTSSSGGSGGSGQNNTDSNVGIGIGVFQTQVGFDSRFHSLLAGTGISISDIGDEIEITNTASSGSTFDTMENIGTGEASIYAGNTTDTNFTFKTLKQARGITLTNNTNDVTIGTSFFANSLSCAGTDKLKTYNNATGIFTCEADIDTDTGEVNTASNVGTGEGSIFKQKTGFDLEFKTLKQARGITITNNTSDVTLGTSFYANSKTCAGTDKFSAYNNATGVYTCSTDLDTDTTGILTLNADATAAQVIAGTANQITIAEAGATHTLNVGTDVVQIDQANTYTGANAQALGTSFFTFGSDPGDSLDLRLSNTGGLAWEAAPTGTDITLTVDASEDLVVSTGAHNINLNANPLVLDPTDPADAGSLRMSNAELIAWEASPTGTDVTMTADASENLVLSSGWNNVDLGLNPMINSIFDVAGTGNRLTSASIAAGDLLKGDGTDFKRFARGANGECLKATAGDLAWGACAAGSGLTSLNADATAAQVIAGTANQITIAEAGATHTLNVGTDVVQIDQANTYTGSNAQALGTSFLTFGSDPGDSLGIRISNADGLSFEASPTGTDGTIIIDASENLVLSSGWNNVDLGLNPMINSSFDTEGTGNILTSSGATAGDILVHDGTEYQEFDKGSGGAVLHVKSDSTTLEYIVVHKDCPNSTNGQQPFIGVLNMTSNTLTCFGVGAQMSIFLVASWNVDVTKTNIGTSFVDIYTETNANGDAVKIFTSGNRNARILINWDKIGAGTQTCQLKDVDSTDVLIPAFTVVSGRNDSGNVDIPAGLENTNRDYKLQCKSTTAADDPVFRSAFMYLEPIP